MNDKDTLNDVKRTASSLAIIAPFSYPLIMMPVIIRHDIKSIVGTNGVSIFVNPADWTPLSYRQKLFYLMHEWLHIIMQHAKRMQGRNRKVWNAACDFAVNGMIIDTMSEKISAPEDIYYDDSFENKTAEEIYSILSQEINKEEDKKSGNQSHFQNILKRFKESSQLSKQEVVDMLKNDSEDLNKFEDLSQQPSTVEDNQLIDNIIKAAARAKSMKKGFMPGAYEEYVKALKVTKIPWERILLRYAKESLKGSMDRNPYKPDPKYLPFDMFIPTENSNKVSKLVFIIDTSNSMQLEEFEEACGHLQKLGNLCEKLTVIMADTQVQKVFKLKKIKKEIKENKFKAKGRGGTDMSLAFKEAEKLKPDLIILFSDMEIGNFPERPKKSQVIFLATKDSAIEEIPYGVLVKMDKS